MSVFIQIKNGDDINHIFSILGAPAYTDEAFNDKYQVQEIFLFYIDGPNVVRLIIRNNKLINKFIAKSILVA